VIALFLAAAVGPASQGRALPQGPIDYSADSVKMEPRERRVLLDGKVKLDRADLHVTGDHAVAEFAPEHKLPPRKGKAESRAPQLPGLGQGIERFIVDGSVHVQRGARTAEGARGVLDTTPQTLLLTGTPQAPPVLRDESETLTGDRILIHLDSENVEVDRPRLVLRRSLPEEGAQSQIPTPVRVEAQTLRLDRAQHLARFANDVVVHRADAVVRSPRMDARYDQDGQLTRLELRGGVDLRQGQRRATGRSADYDAQTRKVVLTGDPKLYDRGDVLAGERIDLDLDSKDVSVQKARGRLRPELHQDEARP